MKRSDYKEVAELTGVAALYPELAYRGMAPLEYSSFDDLGEACLVSETLTLYAHLLNGCAKIFDSF